MPPPSQNREGGWFGHFIYFDFQTISAGLLGKAGSATFVVFDFQTISV
jgi:hypothetical protein